MEGGGGGLQGRAVGVSVHGRNTVGAVAIRDGTGSHVGFCRVVRVRERLGGCSNKWRVGLRQERLYSMVKKVIWKQGLNERETTFMLV